MFDLESPLLFFWYFSLYHKTNIYSKRMGRLLNVRLLSVKNISLERYQYHKKYKITHWCWALFLVVDKSYVYTPALLARYKNATVAGYLLELLLTWFKKYHLLFPDHTSTFISSWVYFSKTIALVNSRKQNITSLILLGVVKCRHCVNWLFPVSSYCYLSTALIHSFTLPRKDHILMNSQHLRTGLQWWPLQEV